MTNTSESIQDKTYTVNADIKYSLATVEPTHTSDNSWVLSGHVQSVSTNRTDGQIKLRVAPREILEPDNTESTQNCVF